MRKLVLVFLYLVFGTIQAQNSSLLPPIEISVLTFGPGSTLNDAFGHNAIRVKTRFTDEAYDYGRYDFDDPNFYTNFARGKLKYLQGKSNYSNIIAFYKSQNRTIKEQVLDLSEEERIRLYTYLINNYKPENRAYLYDFFYDNCATKIRDITEEVLDNSLDFNDPQTLEQKTFRDLIQDNLEWNSWGSLGIDIALGSVIDKNAASYEYMFLPEYIFQFFEVATFKGSERPLVKDSKIINSKMETPTKLSSFFFSPFFVFCIISIVIVYFTYSDYKNKKRTVWLDVIGFFITGLIGILILMLWFATDHSTTAQNYNLLWAFALNIIFVHQILKKELKSWFKKYLKFLILMLGLLVLHWIVGIQKFALALSPLIIALFIRYIFLVRYTMKKL